MIPISKIKPSPKPIRSKWDEKAMEELRKSIAEQGLIVPIKVRPLDGEYEIVYGHRRVEAMRRLGWKECEAIVEGMDLSQAHIQAFIENVQREDLTPMDKARALRAIQEATGWPLMEIERRGIMSATYAGQLLRLLDEPPELTKGLEAVGAQEALGADDVYRIATTLGDDTQAKIAVAKKVQREGLTRDQVRAVARAVKAAPDEATRQAILETPLVRRPEEVIEEIEVERVREERERREIAEEKKIRWERFPSTKDFLEILRMHQRLIKRGWEAAKDEKIAPDHLHYLTQRMKETVRILQDIIEQMEAKALERY